MEAVVLVIHLIVALAIIGVVLLQPSESGGFLGSSGSMSNLMAPRRTGDVLTRLTMIFVGIFFITSLTLAIMAERAGSEMEKSILDVTPAATAPVKTQAPAAKTETPKAEAPKAETSKAEVPAAKTTEKPKAPISQ